MNYKIFEKENETFFKYNPIKKFKKVTAKKIANENPFKILKNLDIFFKKVGKSAAWSGGSSMTCRSPVQNLPAPKEGLSEMRICSLERGRSPQEPWWNLPEPGPEPG